jgi:hypothetical protein
MKHTIFLGIRLASFWAVLAWALPVHAAPPDSPEAIHTHWADLCHVAGAHQLNVTTTDGTITKGTCTSTNDSEIALTSNQRVVKIARATLTRIQMYQPGNGHHLADLGSGMSKSFNRGFGWLFSPAAPLGLVAIPATVAWGAVAAPFCLLGDMGDNGPKTQEIKVSD